MTSDAATATRLGLTLPAGFGTDDAGSVDQVGDRVTGYAVGDRAYAAALSRAPADRVIADTDGSVATGVAHHTPDGVDDRTAATLAIAGSTAAAALAILDLGPGDTVLIGAAPGPRWATSPRWRTVRRPGGGHLRGPRPRPGSARRLDRLRRAWPGTSATISGP